MMQVNDSDSSVADLIREELFYYAKSNMALVNVYIKVSSLLRKS